MRDRQGGLGRVEWSNPGAFFFIFLGAVLGLTCPPVATAQHQAREQARNEAVSMTGGPVPRSVPGSLLVTSTHRPRPTSLHLPPRGTCLRMSLGYFN